MALAMLTTLYGALLAYLVCLPLADKLAERARQELLNREIVVHGLLSILSGYHPRVVEGRLLGLLEPGFRPQWRPRRERSAAA
jgi:chemotaxis protein MotA